jgi:beta-lactamase regulating signal transducer with metallopeptidase domain
MPTLLDFALRATVILLLAGAATLLMRRAPAAGRHLVWVLAFAGLIAAPLASVLLPRWRIPVSPAVARTIPAVAVDQPVVATTAAPPSVSTRAVTAATAAISEPAPARLDWGAVALLVWAAGAVLMVGALLVGRLRLWLLARSAEPVTAGAWTGLVGTLSRELGISRRVTLLRAGGPAMPMTWGVGRPVILVPAEADQWPEAQRRQVLLHELAHVRRYDVLTQLVARLVCAVYWFHPLAWVAAARLRVERERACDDLVLRSGAKASDYAGHLLEIARTLRLTPAAGLASVAMARPSHLATRLLEVLDARRRRDRVGPRAAVPAAMAAAAVVLPLALALPVARLEERPLEARATYARTPRPSRPTLLSLAVAPDTLKECDPRTSGKPRRHSSVHVNNGTAVHLTIGRCDVVFTAEGDFSFTDDYSDIKTVERGGEVIVELDDGRTLRRLAIRPGSGGSLERQYTVDRATAPFDAAAKEWLAETLTLMFRSSGLAAPERAQWILNNRGINGLVDEIALLEGDYTRRQYYDVAIASGKLDDAATERLVLKAGAEITSDYELAELLINLASRRPLTAGMQEGFVKAAGSIQSDYERRRVLDAALQRRDLTPAVATAMLEAATDINSDYELAELLIGIQRIRPMDDAVREAFFTALNTLQSDYEHRRVLTAVIQGRVLTPAMLAAAIESGTGIRSDYEMAEFLTEIARSNVVDEPAARAYLLAAKTIQSDHEAGRALAALSAQRNVTPAVVRELIETARVIQSDYELAELLIAIARAHRIDESLRPVYEATAATIQSQYDYDRAMAAIGRRGVQPL